MSLTHFECAIYARPFLVGFKLGKRAGFSWKNKTCDQEPRGTEKLGSTHKDSSGKLICMSDTVKSQQFIYDFPKSGKGGISLRYPVVRGYWFNMF